MRKTGLRPISDKRRKQIEEERVIRQKLWERCGGRCEKCGRLPDWRGIHPHEKLFRSQGGKLSMENSIMLCSVCHDAEHGLSNKRG